jgi:hypothetical protein
MRQRGRPSANFANLVAFPGDPAPPRLESPTGLKPDERALFRELVATTDARQLRPSDQPLLVSFVQATIMARKAAKNGDVAAWERVVRTQAMLAVKLRLCPHSRVDARAAGRLQARPSAYDLLREGDDE